MSVKGKLVKKRRALRPRGWRYGKRRRRYRSAYLRLRKTCERKREGDSWLMHGLIQSLMGSIARGLPRSRRLALRLSLESPALEQQQRHLLLRRLI